MHLESEDFEILIGELPWSDRTKWLMPADDKHTIYGAFDVGPVDVDGVLEKIDHHIKDWRTCVQAGGCVGIWPIRLAQFFDHVLTFEPHHVNYECLSHNTKDIDNISRYRAALGKDKKQVHMEQEGRWVGHSGAWFVVDGGNIPMVRVDDLGLDDVDLICLDIEGYECNAILGAAETIERCQPVITFEDRHFYQRFGESRPLELLENKFGYKNIGRGNKDDLVMVPC